MARTPPKRGVNGLSESFMARANEAAFWEAWVGAVLSRAGLWTVHHPFTLAESADKVSDYGHTWDLDVGTQDPATHRGDAWQVEVKSTNKTFTGPDDWGTPDLLVCSQASFLRKWPGRDKVGRDFLFVSRYTGAVVWLPINTPVTLNHDQYDHGRGELYSVVKASKDSLRALTDFVQAIRD